MTQHPDQRYIEGLLHNDIPIVREIYMRFSATVKRYILQNQGCEEDAADIFQEALVDLYNQAKHKDLKLTCPFEAFLLLLCKRKWLNVLKKRGRNRVTNSEEEVYKVGEDVFAMAERIQKEEGRAKLFLEQFERLSEKCRQVIGASLTGEAQEKIAEMLGVSYGYLRKKKSECMASLMALIQNNLNSDDQ